MRKITAVLITLLILFSCAGAEVGESFSAAREKADRIEREYGIRILIGNECSLDNTSYLVFSAEATSSVSKAAQAGIKTEEALEILGQALACWPAGMIEYFDGKLTFCLVGDIVSKGNGERVAGITHHEGDAFFLYLDIRLMSPRGVHHEGWHAAEIRSGAEFKDWNTLNPAGFEYTWDYYYQGFYDQEWFYRTYSVTHPGEDRATVFEAYMLEPEEWWEAHPHIRRKLDAMMEAVPEVFGGEP